MRPSVALVDGRIKNRSARWYEVMLQCPCFDYQQRFLNDVPDTRIEELDTWATMRPVWSPDSKHIATVAGAGLVVWDAASGEQLLHEPLDLIPAGGVMAWSPDGSRIVASGSSYPLGDDKQAQTDSGSDLLLLDSEGGPLFSLVGQTGAVFNLAWSPDGTRVAAAGHELRIWDAQQGNLLVDVSTFASDAAWSPDGRRIAVAELNAEQNASLLGLRDSASGELLASHGPSEHLHFILVDWSTDGAYVIGLAWNMQRQNDGRVTPVGSTLLAWDGSERTSPIKVFESDDVFAAMDFSPDGRFVVLPIEGGLHVYAGAGRRVASLLPGFPLPMRGPVTDDTFFIEKVAWSPDGQGIVATGLSLGNLLKDIQPAALVWDLTLIPEGPVRAFIHAGDLDL